MRRDAWAGVAVSLLFSLAGPCAAQTAWQPSPGHTDDPVDPVENSLVYYAALRKAGVPAEMHVYVKGGHAFGLRPTESPITRWPQLVETWLRTIGMISP